MSADELPPYEPWMRDLLEIEREREDLPMAVEQRILDRVLASAVQVAPGMGSEGLPHSDAASSLSARGVGSTTTNLVMRAKVAAIVSGAVGMVVGGALGVVSYRAFVPPRERIVTRVEIREHKAETPIKVAPPIETAAPPKTSVAEDAGTPRIPLKPRTTSTRPQDTRDLELAAENALITRMQNALARGKWEEALKAAKEHERGYANGRFVEEREALAIQALVKRGELVPARARAARFYKRYPDSMLTRVVRAAVEEP